MTLRAGACRPGDAASVRLIACGTCHTQYDVSQVTAESFDCRCGERLANRPLTPVDAKIQRCAACGAGVAAAAKTCEFCQSAIVREGDPRKLSLICPECCARNLNDARFCTACGVAFRPESVRPAGYELPCPVCDVLMPPQGVAGIPVNECTTCGGLWVPGEHFERLIARAMEARKQRAAEPLNERKPRVKGANPAAQKVQYRKCPVCNVQMHRRNFRKSSGVILDVCSEHGSWLDADELEQITGFILSGGATSPLLGEARSYTKGESRALVEMARARAQLEVERQRRQEPRGVADGVLGLIKLLLD
jgi:Zn-finger nucleic acid-binding protein